MYILYCIVYDIHGAVIIVIMVHLLCFITTLNVNENTLFTLMISHSILMNHSEIYAAAEIALVICFI